jgi:hypothetical protein
MKQDAYPGGNGDAHAEIVAVRPVKQPSAGHASLMNESAQTQSGLGDGKCLCRAKRRILYRTHTKSHLLEEDTTNVFFEKDKCVLTGSA